MDRLPDEPEHMPPVHRIHGRIQIGIAGEHHPRRIGRQRGALLEEMDAVHPRHLQVRHDHGERRGRAQGREPCLGVLGGDDPEIVAQRPADPAQDQRIVIHEENARGQSRLLLNGRSPGAGGSNRPPRST